MNTRLLKLILSCLVLGIATYSCDLNKDKTDQLKIVTSNISLPSSLEIEEGEAVSVNLLGTTNISQDKDQVVLRDASYKDYFCPITSFKDASVLVFKLPEGFSGGTYKVYIRHEGLNNYVGTLDLTILSSHSIQPEPGTGIYGIVQCEGKGVPGVLVSDGAEIVKTDSNGIYQMKSDKKWKYVFVVIPSGYEVPVNGILPKFHAALSQSPGTPERKDFTLIKSDNDRFNLYVLGDMHLANRNEDISQFSKVANTLNECLSSSGTKNYVMTLGDMTWDLYWYSKNYQFPQYLSTMDKNFKDITFFHTMGNHDNDMNSVGDYNKSFRYTRDIAPTFYSFNLGKIHFVVMDNIDYNNVGSGSDLRSEYKRNYTAEQMAWLAKDLSYVDKSTPVFITSHAPLSVPSGAVSWNNNYLNGADSAGEANMIDFQNAVREYNVQFISGHTHNIFNRKYSNKLSEHNGGAVCASWWWSGHLTSGIHISQDGAPGGFGIWTFDGTDFSHSYRAAGHDADYQFRAYDMNKVKEVIVPSAGASHPDFVKFSNAIQKFSANTILVNVWDYGPDWKVSIREGGNELNVTAVSTYDPLHIMALSAPRCKSASASSTPSFLTTTWSHFFLATASSASSTVTVSVTDGLGKTYTETMHRPKAFDIAEYKNK